MSVRDCPNCGGKSSVYYCLEKGGLIVRYRKCGGCRMTWQTVELLRDDYRRMKEVADDFRSISGTGAADAEP